MAPSKNGKRSWNMKKRKYLDGMNAAYSAANLIGKWWRSRNPPKQFTDARNKKRKYSESKEDRTSCGIVPAGVSGPGSQSSYKYPVNYMNPAFKAAATCGYIVSNGTNVTTTAPKQAYATVTNVFNSTDCAAMCALINATENKLLFNSYYAETMIANPLNITQRVTIYDVICKKDVAASNIRDPAQALIHEYGAIFSGSVNNDLIVGSTPFSCPGFLEYYKIVNTTRLLLQSGQVHTHCTRGSPNKIIDSENFQLSQYGLGGFTRFVMIQVHGTPVNDSVGTSTVSLSACRLNIVSKIEYHYRAIGQQARRFEIGAQLSAVPNNAQFEEMYVQGNEVTATT